MACIVANWIEVGEDNVEDHWKSKRCGASGRAEEDRGSVRGHVGTIPEKPGAMAPQCKIIDDSFSAVTRRRCGHEARRAEFFRHGAAKGFDVTPDRDSPLPSEPYPANWPNSTVTVDLR